MSVANSQDCTSNGVESFVGESEILIQTYWYF